MSGLLSLPDEVLKLVLTHVPLKERLVNCSLVHSRLHAAAVAATQQLETGYSPMWQPERGQSVFTWLSRYGEHVTRLDVDALDWVTQLPCPNLLQLRLVGTIVQLGPTADGPGVIAGITKLTRLELHYNGIDDGPVVDSLSELVHLQHLEWFSRNGYGEAGFSIAVLPQLRHLTHLGAHADKHIAAWCTDLVARAQPAV